MLDNQKPIIFLDFDGVVNTFYWEKQPDGSLKHTMCWPSDGYVNNIQAIGWLNELFYKIPYDIVVSSTWRMHLTEIELQEILWRSGLKKDIKVVGKTPVLYQQRGFEIEKWLKDNNFKQKFIILDDDSDMGELLGVLVRCDCYNGFGLHEFNKAFRLLDNENEVTIKKES